MSRLGLKTFIIFIVVCFMCLKPCIRARSLNSQVVTEIGPPTTMKIMYGGYREGPSERGRGHETPPTTPPVNIVYGVYREGPSERGRGHETPPTTPPVKIIYGGYKEGPSERGQGHDTPPTTPPSF
ncbi:unnamed protein product [Microthlaspi erraticum]|uniref:Uncharacterized protein n=1 Tax=Microthlaspi erraticum TaxID=1685480 RepID=A0A6D2HG02_9BRAS|nr:unnamed protein product [Microthlaspi erraticum]